MSIRIKFLGTIFLIVLFLSVVFFLVMAPIVGGKLDTHEKTAATRKVKQVQGIFNYQFESLSTLAADLANWHDVNQIVSGSNDENFAADITRNTFVNNARIDLLLTFDKDKNLTHSVFYDKHTNSVEDVNADLLQAIVTHEDLLIENTSVSPPRDLHIFPFNDRFLVVASSIIPVADNPETNNGAVVLGRFIDEEAIAHLQEMTQYKVDFFPLDEGPIDIKQAASELQNSSRSYLLKFVSEDTIKGYALLYDVSGNGTLMMTLTIDRYLFKQHHNSLPFLLKAIMLCCVVFGIALFVFIELSISQRFKSLIAEIKAIEKSGVPGSRLSEGTKSDEFGKLARSINNLLATNEAFEEYKLKTKRLESIATFAAGASHELSTPLSTLAVASGEMLRELVKGEITSEDLYDDLFLIREQVDRCKFIVNQIAANTGSHLGEEKRDFTLQKLIDDTLVQFKQSEVELINIQNQLEDLRLYMPFQSLCRVLRGLLRNALEASDNGNSITLDCKESETHYMLSVKDTGKGMDANTLSHATDPFFSTKNPGQNLGLGLFLAQSLAGRFNGNLEIESALGKGTTMTISFAKDKVYAN